MKKHLFKHLLAIGLLAFQLPALAEDIDLFVNNAGSNSTAPNVLFIVDNTANWNQAFANEMAALANTVAGLSDNTFRVGIMFAAETGSPNTNTDGGYVRAAMRLMDGTTKPLYRDLVLSFDKLNDKGNGGVSSLVMAEAFRYFSGGAPIGGSGKIKADYAGNTLSNGSGGTAASRAVWALQGNALSSLNAPTYNAAAPNGCQKNYIIYISNGASSDNSSVITASTNALAAAGGNTTTIPLSPAASQGNMSDEWARFMNKASGYGIRTYAIDVDPKNTGQGPGWSALLYSMTKPENGDGKYYAVSSASGSGAIVDAINDALAEIQAVNSVFASVSLPVSVNTQGTYLNQVYVGMFRPDGNDFPRWAGNMKQYKLGYIKDVLKLQDADGAAAINNGTGFITECARSFWTPPKTSVDNYWAFRPQGGCPAPSSAGDDKDYYARSNTPDGNVVDKGAQAYVLRSTTTRTVKTCSSTFSSCTSLVDFNNTSVSQSSLGAASTTERDNIITWVKGQDIQNENTSDGVTPSGTSTLESTVMRPSVHGDVVHSRPVAINYGTAASPSIVVYYGGNDGILRAINGNRDANLTSAGNIYAPGAELWAFAAPESFGVFKRLYDNTTKVLTPLNTTGSPTPLPKPYGVDGPITAYKDDSHTWIYATMRRGGRVLYAFDVTTPGNPSLKWKKGCPSNFPTSGTVSDTNCTNDGTGDFRGIGQTWSSPKAFMASGHSGGTSPLLIMGGGYDTCEDADQNTCSASGYTKKGNHIYVIDADSGDLLKTFDTDRSVVGDVTVVPDATTGLAIYAYAADMGGNVYRITIGNAAPASWSFTKIASLGCDTVASCASNRKFMFAPDVALDNGVYILTLGSGDREKPLSTYTNSYAVANKFFMIKDKPDDPNWLSSESGNCSGTSVICLNSLYHVTQNSTSTAQSAVDAKKGWYLDLLSHEQVVTSSITLYGVVTFSTHQPATAASATCGSNLGTTYVYNVNYTNGDSSYGGDRYRHVAGNGMPPSPVAGMVTLDDGKTIPFIIGANPDSPLEASVGKASTATAGGQARSRVYWYVQQ